ncbi:polysaccharide pyruvyl transferase family protein [Advenella sp. FME57]|uniref:polysaccharide pyruvyl transferase family protein n=1 Tax=Advenella sp. FME57 TaxID=2742604 RepID=UPI0018677245|nr:polysaccharide pyruvyl transferase family protein [Advenella sp. FME57]
MNNQSGSTQQSSIIEKRLELQGEVTGCEPLISNLKEFAENDAIYLPSAGNFGDGLIGLGTLYLFEKIGINPNMQDILTDSSLPQAKHLIVGGGGGWLDGLWNHYAQILDGYLAQGGQVLILPSTVKGFESFFEKYASQITIFARERVSYDHLKAIRGMQDRVFLCHDLAFATDFSAFNVHGIDHRSGRLNLFREDEEARNAAHYTHNYDLSLLWNSQSWFDKDMCIRRLSPLLELMSQFEQIHSDRLHMSILGTLMGCEVTMHPSGYFKNRAVYDYSLSRFSNVTFTDSKPDQSEEPGSVSRVRDPQDLQVIEHAATDIAALNESLISLTDRHRMLNEELQDTRDRNLNYAYRLDALSRQLEDLSEDRPTAQQQAFLDSRGYRLWVRYNRLYENEHTGPALRKLRSAGGRILRQLGVLK